MKTSKFFVVAVLSGLMFVSAVNATEGGKPVKATVSSANDVRSQIVDALRFAGPANEEVVIRFSVNETNGFELLNVEGNDFEVVNAVKAELKNEKIDVPAEMKGVYSLRVRFAETEEAPVKVDATKLFREELASVLSEVVVAEPASVKVAFSVSNTNVVVKKIEGNNTALVSKVEKVLGEKKVVAPAELAGNYQVVVKF